MTLRQELNTILAAYCVGEATVYDCYEWISGISWDDAEFRSDPTLMERVGELELLATEVIEGMRPESEFRQAATI